MLNYENKIKSFVEQNFKKGNPEIEAHWYTSGEILNILFAAFPVGCIDDYELNDILEPLFDRRLRVRGESKIEEGKIVQKITPPQVFWIINISE